MILFSSGTCRVELRKGEQRTVRTRRPLLGGKPFVWTLLIFPPHSFLNHCVNLAYRNITLCPDSMAPDRPTAGSPCTVPPSGSPEARRACTAPT
jgi:hypothetical protein